MGNRMILDELIFGHCGAAAEEAGGSGGSDNW